MIIIVGLGNPGKEYENTYHNMGFLAIDRLSELFDIKISKTGLKSKYGEGNFAGQKIILVKPQTYMNNSGESVVLWKNKFKDAKILVLVDDIDLPRGTVRYRERGSAGTHNGLRSIVSYIGQEFERVKIGIGREEGDLANYVLSKIDPSFVEESMDKMVEIVQQRVKDTKI
jgi:PTH1 family peptidyl-tRNA hydrolase